MFVGNGCLLDRHVPDIVEERVGDDQQAIVILVDHGADDPISLELEFDVVEPRSWSCAGHG